MPFRSVKQMRAAFGGYLGKEMQEKAQEFADKTPSIKALPEKVGSKHKNASTMKIHPTHDLHTSAHRTMSAAHMKKHHMEKMHVHDASHPMHKHYKQAITHVRHADGTHKTMAMLPKE